MAAAAIEFAKGDIFVVMDRDSKTKHIAEILFPLLLDTLDLTDKHCSSTESDGDENEPEDRIYFCAHGISEAAVFCHGFMGVPHWKAIKCYFSKHRICRKHVFRFLKNYCLIISKQSVNIQFAVLHSLSLVYQLVHFCNRRGDTKYRDCFPLWWEYVFNKTFKDKFYSDGGWENLAKYSKGPLSRDISNPDFRAEWNLTSATLGCDFSDFELSDVDDFPCSD